MNHNSNSILEGGDDILELQEEQEAHQDIQLTHHQQLSESGDERECQFEGTDPVGDHGSERDSLNDLDDMDRQLSKEM